LEDSCFYRTHVRIYTDGTIRGSIHKLEQGCPKLGGVLLKGKQGFEDRKH
jgi:hypothetical protein